MNRTDGIGVGSKIVWTGDYGNPDSLREGTVTKLTKDLLWVDNQHLQEDCIYLVYCWPARVKDELLAILKERQRLQKAADDSMKLVYQLSNAIARGEK